jgi:hypothetical protein
MTTPKPAKAWAVYDEKGNMVPYAIAENEYRAKQYMCLPDKTTLDSWEYYYNRGYRCLPVTITPEKEG